MVDLHGDERARRRSGGSRRFAALAALGVAVGATVACSSTLVDQLEAARRGDPQDVRAATTALGEMLRAREAERIPYDEGALKAVEYLEEVARSEGDPIQRAQAVAALSRLEQPKIEDLLADSLSDSSWLVRLEAAKGWLRRPAASASAPLARQLRREERVEVRLEIVRALAAVGGPEALRVLLELFLDVDATGRYQSIRLTLYDGLVQLSGEKIPFEQTEAWKQLYETKFGAPTNPGAP